MPHTYSIRGEFFAGRIIKSSSLVTARTPEKLRMDWQQIYRVHALAAKSSYLIQTALGSSPVITIFYRLGIRTHNQISVHSGGYQNALTQNAGALKDYMVDQIAAGLIQQIVLSA